MKKILVFSLLVTLIACSPSQATQQVLPSQTQAIIPKAILQPTTVSTATDSPIFATLTARALLPTKTPIAMLPTETSIAMLPTETSIAMLPTETSIPTTPTNCTANNGSLGAMINENTNTFAIQFNITDCKITAVFVQGNINGQWLIFSNEADEPITGSQFDFLYSFSDQDKYNLSGTFTSPTSASIQMVIFKGFRITADQPSPFTSDLILNGTANP